MLGEGPMQPSTGVPSYALGGWVFVRLLGLIYLAAFISLATQVRGLVGRDGILPARELLASRKRHGPLRFLQLPTLCWLDSSDAFLLFLCWAGAGLSVLLVAGIAPGPVLVLLWVFYLSLFNVSGIFLGYQWDILLLETGFLGVFFAPQQWLAVCAAPAAPPVVVRWLLWWLLFRLMFSSGMVKLRSGDRAWRRLTALCHHYQTQPLPTPLAWYVHQLPLQFHRFSAVLMFAIELFAPFLIPVPGVYRHVAAFLFIFLMVLIQLTGNYGFFNLLGIALSVLLLDDKILRPAFEPLFKLGLVQLPSGAAPAPNGLGLIVAGVILLLSIPIVLRLFRIEWVWPAPIAFLFEFLDRIRLVNSYGLFSVMTTERPELIIEGSQDSVTWREYQFKFKPGELTRRPRFIAPHQARLDWQMWFAALGYYPNHAWVERFLERLLEDSTSVVRLLRSNPFPDKPPRYIRAILYDYRFTDREERRATRAWWRRKRCGLYSPVLEGKVL